MSPRVEGRRYQWEDPEVLGFFAQHGYAVVRGVLSDGQCDEARTAWAEVVSEAAGRCGIHPVDFVERFPQNRDLWRKNERFKDLLYTSSQATLAQDLLGVSGVRLFHDHAICKPARASGSIPWHQDSAYWPLDRVGVSLWTPVDDVPSDGGCLKVLDGSHRDGPFEPQDFLASGAANHDADPRVVYLPVARGDTVVLSGLTWHASDPNRGPLDRLAYLTLWVPATSRFVPEHAGWHPTSAHISVAPGDRLDGEWFPVFGEVAQADEGDQVRFPVPPRISGPSMFTASRDIAGQIAWLLGRPAAPLGVLLAGGATPVVQVVVAAGLVPADRAREVQELLDDLALQEQVRRDSTARDVYLRSVQRWWCLVGAQIEEGRDGR